MPGIKHLPTSFYALDHEMHTDSAQPQANTVIRLDSLSKFIAPGMRLGWVAGPAEFITKYVMFQEITSQVRSIVYVYGSVCIYEGVYGGGGSIVCNMQ